MRLAKTACTCADCQAACERSPGWFRPGEPERAAQLLGFTLADFFRRWLGVTWSGVPPTFVLAPATVHALPGAEYAAPGRCVFFVEGRCQIHAAKPYECAHGSPHDRRPAARDAFDASRRHTLTLWQRRQNAIVELLGRTPQVAP